MSINRQNSNLQKYWQLLPVLFLCIIWTMNNRVQAEPRGVDVYSINSSNQKTNLPWQNNTNSNSVGIWFDKLDKLRQLYKPTEKDKVILTRPLMQDSARVQQWTNTASKISKNYLALAKSIRGLSVPPGMSDVKEYRDLIADWYQDSAGIYTDMIRPRPPAKTIEDLQEEIDAVKKRAEGLANNMANLKAMDREIRQAHKLPRQRKMMQFNNLCRVSEEVWLSS